MDGLIARRMPPGWQLYLLIGLYPVLWGLGLAYFVWPVAAGVFVLSLCLRSAIRVPPGFGIWILFLMWMLFSAIELSTAQQVGLFAWRAVIYLTATGVFLWIYNAAADDLPDDTVAGALTVLWALAVVGGLVGVFYLDVLVPHARRSARAEVVPQQPDCLRLRPPRPGADPV